jgi:HSP20 family protein
MSKREFELARRGGIEPFDLLRRMTADFDRVFDRKGWPFWWTAFRPTTEGETGWYPQVDVFEHDNRLITRIDLPGVKKEDVKVEVTEDQLVISGERRTENEEKKGNVYRSERSFGSFSRVVSLPENVKFEDIAATFQEGVLEVSVPLPPARASVAPRKVEVRAPDTAAKAA